MEKMRTRLLISVACLLAACSGDPGSGGADTARVYTGTGARQCETDGLSLERSAQALVEAGIDVLDSSCGVMTGVAFPAVCGAPTGEILVHEIRSVNVPDAGELDYENVESLVDPEEGTGYRLVDCETRAPLE